MKKNNVFLTAVLAASAFIAITICNKKKYSDESNAESSMDETINTEKEDEKKRIKNDNKTTINNSMVNIKIKLFSR